MYIITNHVVVTNLQSQPLIFSLYTLITSKDPNPMIKYDLMAKQDFFTLSGVYHLNLNKVWN
jgi:hypothetical protein